MIDVVHYSDKVEDYLKQAIAPAKVREMVLDNKKRVADIFVDGDQRPLAIGRNGQNVRLASILTGYEINLRDIEEFKGKGAISKVESNEEETEDTASEVALAPTDAKVTDLDIADAMKKKLIAAGIEDVETLRKMSSADLTMIGGIGKAGAEKIVKAAKEIV